MHVEFLATCIQASRVSCRQTASDCHREAALRERSLLAPLASVQLLLQCQLSDAHYFGRQAELLEEIHMV